MRPIEELNIEKYQVAAFDWDGTLVDSPSKYRELDKLFIEESYGVEVSLDEVGKLFNERWAEYNGDDFWNEYYKHLDEKYGAGQKAVEEIFAERQTYIEQLQQNIEYKPQVPEILRKMRENHTLRMVLATNSGTSDIEFISENSSAVADNLKPAEFFDKIWTYDDVENRKPHPEVHQKIMAHFAIEKSGLIVFEDSLSGVQAAKNAGADVLVVYDKDSDYDRDEINDLADFYVRDWDEIGQLL